MTSKLIPQDPSKVMVIRQITANLTTCSAPFNRYGKFKVGGRGTIGWFICSLPNLVLYISDNKKKIKIKNSPPPIWRPSHLLAHGPHARSAQHNIRARFQRPLPHRARLRTPHLPIGMGQRLPLGQNNHRRGRTSRKTRLQHGPIPTSPPLHTRLHPYQQNLLTNRQ